MGGLRQCANEDTPHFTDDPIEMFCMQCGLHFLPATNSIGKVEGKVEIPDLDSDDGRGAAPTILEGSDGEAIVRFPWGEERVSERLTVGRDPSFSPIAAQLGAFPTVSGRHAEFWLRKDGLVLIHVGRSNPTYVNGREIDPHVEVPVPDGTRVHFSNQCECTVRIER